MVRYVHVTNLGAVRHFGFLPFCGLLDPYCTSIPNFSKTWECEGELLMIQQIFSARFFSGEFVDANHQR